MSRNLSAAEKDNSLFYEKEKHPSDSCVTLQDSEAEAEAAASAIAVAAISSDEIVAHGLGSVGFSDAKNFRGSDIGGIIAGRFEVSSPILTQQPLPFHWQVHLTV